MAVVFGFLLFLIGFAMLMAGVGLLIGGEIKLKGGKKIPRHAGRKAGIALVGFLPGALIVIFIFRKVIPDQAIPSAAVTGPLALVCLGLAARWVLQGISGSKLQRRNVLTGSSGSNDALVPTEAPIILELADPPPNAAAGRLPRAQSAGPNPFDFS